LDVNVYDEPTEEHFDPEEACFIAVSSEGGVGPLTVTHPWSRRSEYRICAGHIYLEDRQDKSIDAFSFGGKLVITTHPTHTSCTLTSPAPIFEIPVRRTVTGIVVSKFEAMLARRRARWIGDQVGFERRLASVDPLILFAAVLVRIEEKLKATPSRSRDYWSWQALDVIHDTMHQMQREGTWPSSLPPLADLL
jgi:hypothetical protein